MGQSYTKLHWNILERNWEKVLRRIEKHPEEVRKKNEHLNLPIHFACYTGVAPLRVIRTLVDLYPESVHELNKKGFDATDLARKNYPPSFGERVQILEFLMTGSLPNDNDETSMAAPQLCNEVQSENSDLNIPTYNTEQCVICLYNDVTHLCSPCGHACLCESCAKSVVETGKPFLCPIGRCEIEKITKFRISSNCPTDLVATTTCPVAAV